jgi:hypothetical protein
VTKGETMTTFSTSTNHGTDQASIEVVTERAEDGAALSRAIVLGVGGQFVSLDSVDRVIAGLRAAADELQCLSDADATLTP